MKRTVQSLLTSLCLILLSGALLAAPAAGLPTTPIDPVLGEEGKVSVWTYNKAFAKRFNLPEMEEEGLPPDIQAMELRLVKRILDGGSSYECQLHVYANNSLKIQYPEGDVGSIETLRMGSPVHPAKMPDSHDRLFHADQSGKYTTKAVFSSYTNDKPSLGGGVTYLHYRKYFLSDLAYLAFSVGCGVGDPREYNYSFWVEKEGGRDYRQWTKLDPNEFYQFDIPRAFVHRFYPHAKNAQEANHARIDAENKARREKLQQPKSDQAKH